MQAPALLKAVIDSSLFLMPCIGSIADKISLCPFHAADLDIFLAQIIPVQFPFRHDDILTGLQCSRLDVFLSSLDDVTVTVYQIGLKV